MHSLCVEIIKSMFSSLSYSESRVMSTYLCFASRYFCSLGCFVYQTDRPAVLQRIHFEHQYHSEVIPILYNLTES